jgi:hypothetical protein
LSPFSAAGCFVLTPHVEVNLLNLTHTPSSSLPQTRIQEEPWLQVEMFIYSLEAMQDGGTAFR